eukprot:GDKK01056265.1.p1 GENE.GDKK01056265.1~~GDKK01056265.1.p1  ORF type:complete len:100 (+),score=6.03 GDKK01056265.1:1-300(+)
MARPTKLPISLPTTRPSRSPTRVSALPGTESSDEIVELPSYVVAVSVIAGVICVALGALLFYKRYSREAIRQKHLEMMRVVPGSVPPSPHGSPGQSHPL